MKDVLAVLFTMLLAVTLVACDSNDDDGDDDNGTDAPTAQVRFIHASPNAGPVDVFVGDTEVAPGFVFNSTEAQPIPNTSDYEDVEVGVGTVIEVRNQNGGVVNSVNVDNEGFQEDQFYTVLVAGATDAEGPNPIVIPDPYDAIPIPGNSIGLRLVHGSARAQASLGAVDVYITPDSTLRGADPLLRDFEFGENSGVDLLSNPGGFAPRELSNTTQIVTVTPAGDTTAKPVQVPIGGDQGLPLQAGSFVTGIAADVSWEEGVDALVLAEDSP